ncbi:MAG TPA: hypothetical protein PKZ00_08675, partial [Elusimicrobiota bacterium]|nr:hypothetical protein [Elusimicrobiota bacterium]
MKRWAMVLLVAGPAVLRAEPPASVEMGDDFPPVQISSGPALASTAPTPAPGAPLRVVHPPEGASLPYVKSSFVLGSVDPGSRLSIDG